MERKFSLQELESALKELRPRLDGDGRFAIIRKLQSSVEYEGLDWATIIDYTEEEQRIYVFELWDELIDWCPNQFDSVTKVGTLCVEFTESTHGDGDFDTIYVLPGGTAMLDYGSTNDFSEDDGLVLIEWTVEELVSKAEELLAQKLSHCWDDLGAWDDKLGSPVRSGVIRFGMQELRQNLTALKLINSG